MSRTKNMKLKPAWTMYEDSVPTMRNRVIHKINMAAREGLTSVKITDGSYLFDESIYQELVDLGYDLWWSFNGIRDYTVEVFFDPTACGEVFEIMNIHGRRVKSSIDRMFNTSQESY